MKKILIVLLVLSMIFTVAGCTGNQSIWDGSTNESNTFHYILTEEAGELHLHTISRWMDSSSDAVGVVTSCCRNRFWTSYNKSVLYAELPNYLPDNVIICGK